MENDIKLADVLKALVENLHKHLDKIQDPKIRLLTINHENKVERSIVPIDDFAFSHIIV